MLMGVKMCVHLLYATCSLVLGSKKPGALPGSVVFQHENASNFARALP